MSIILLCNISDDLLFSIYRFTWVTCVAPLLCTLRAVNRQTHTHTHSPIPVILVDDNFSRAYKRRQKKPIAERSIHDTTHPYYINNTVRWFIRILWSEIKLEICLRTDSYRVAYKWSRHFRSMLFFVCGPELRYERTGKGKKKLISSCLYSDGLRDINRYDINTRIALFLFVQFVCICFFFAPFYVSFHSLLLCVCASMSGLIFLVHINSIFSRCIFRLWKSHIKRADTKVIEKEKEEKKGRKKKFFSQ